MLEKLRNYISALKISRFLPVIIVICAGVTLSFYLFKTQRAEENNLIKADFELVAHDRVSAFKSIIRRYFQLMNQLKAFFDSSQKIDRNEFHTFVTTAIQNEGIQALEWIPRVTDQKRSEYESALREKGYPNFSFTERNAQGKMVNASRREEYFPVYFVEPLEGNEPAFGFDLASNQARLEALNYSRETGKMIATERIRLVQETGEQFGFLVFLPVYRKGVPIDNTDLRVKNLEGFVLGVFRIGDILETALKLFKAGGVDIEILDLSAPKEKSFLYRHNSRLIENKNVSQPHNQIEQVRDISFSASLNIANRKWEIICTPIPEFISSRSTWRPFQGFIAGLLFTGMLAVYMLVSIGRTAKVEKLVTDRTMQLKESEERTRAIVDNVVHGIITIDERGTIENFNRAAEHIFEFKADEVIGKNVKILMPEPYHSEHDGYLKNFLTTRNPKVIGIGREVVGKRKDNATFPMHLAVSEMMIGEKSMFVGIVMDITEQKEAEEKIRISKEEALAASKAKSDFLASMSHEIRTPMNAIIGMSELLSETKLTEEQGKYITTFKNAGENLLSIINDVLDISKIEAGHLEIEHAGFYLHKIIEHVREIMTFRAKEKDLKIITAIADNVPHGVIGDSLRLQQVIINFVGNAIKFTDKGEILISVKVVKVKDDETELLFSVKDEGIGVPEEKHKTIFESFSQADTSTTRKYGGTGLGLSISKRLVELMGGEICLDSAEGKGSTFYFTAIFGIDKDYKKETGKTAADKKKQVDISAAVRPLKILLVEDNKDNRNLILAYLKKSPHKIDIAENGKIAVEKFTSGQYDLVLMDVEMPVMDGLTATREIRDWEKKKNVGPTYIVALTAHALQEHREKTKEAGCDGHITKPIKKKKLIETIVQYT